MSDETQREIILNQQIQAGEEVKSDSLNLKFNALQETINVLEGGSSGGSVVNTTWQTTNSANWDISGNSVSYDDGSPTGFWEVARSETGFQEDVVFSYTITAVQTAVDQSIPGSGRGEDFMFGFSTLNNASAYSTTAGSFAFTLYNAGYKTNLINDIEVHNGPYPNPVMSLPSVSEGDKVSVAIDGTQFKVYHTPVGQSANLIYTSTVAVDTTNNTYYPVIQTAENVTVITEIKLGNQP